MSHRTVDKYANLQVHLRGQYKDSRFALVLVFECFSQSVYVISVSGFMKLGAFKLAD